MRSYKREKNVYEALQQNSHPSFPKFFQSSEKARLFYQENLIKKAAVLRFEYVKGQNLLDFVNDTNPDPKVTGYFLLKISEALHDLHTVFKFAHRDLKLENIMMLFQNDNF